LNRGIATTILAVYIVGITCTLCTLKPPRR
ncbi:MAG: hypothetical protein ACI8TV_001613, partial [Porticoccaceae bacterium]